MIADMPEGPMPIDQLAVEFHRSRATVALERIVGAVRGLRERSFRVLHSVPRTCEI